MELGRPASGQKNKFNDVTIARKANSVDPSQMSPQEKEKYMQNLTGFKKDNKIFVDGEKHNKMGKDEFLKLLTFQLKNQDPMKPMEQGQMAGELAQFSQLEQLTNLNSKFDGMGKDKNIESKFYGASFLGKEVVTNGSSLELKGDGEKADILYNLPKPASKVILRVFDNKNAMIGEVWKENVGRGNQSVTWDGVSLDGTPAIKGEYRVQVMAFDESAQRMAVETKNKGTVESIFFENGETVLQVNGKKVYLRDVDSFHMEGKGRVSTAKDSHTAQAFAGVEQKVGRSAGSNLPIAQNTNLDVNLDRVKKQTGLNTYGKQNVGTGITNVYDTE
jgi:flagellar basal-body rod modification protein FlgD